MTANRSTVREEVVRIDEKMKTIFNRHSSLEKRVNAIDEKINQIGPSVKFGERIFWIILLVTITVIGSYY
tara:strand:- start:305 stop:514 length:210 start_codon:yes stop_codon:yes gene_type:complete